MKSDISATQEAVTSEVMISHASPRQPAASAENRQRDVRDQIVIESEQFKADVNKPTGMHNNFGQINVEDFAQFIKILKDDDDDEFFHLTCHIDQSIWCKI